MTADAFYFSPLFKLVSETFTEFRTPSGIFSVQKFAETIGMSRQGVYKWLRESRIYSIEGVERIAGASHGRLTRDQLYPFMHRT